MFNYAKHRKQKVPKHLQMEEAVFKSKPMEQRLEEDAIALAQTMVRHGLKNAEDAYEMRGGRVEYWTYIDEFQPKHKKKVFKRAEEIAVEFARDFREHPEKFPMPAPPQAGGGAGGGMLAGSSKKIVTADAEIPSFPRTSEASLRQAMSIRDLALENKEYSGTGGVSMNARPFGFRPAFFDMETETIYIVGKLHDVDLLPDELIARRTHGGRAIETKPSIEAGFERDGNFYTRDETAEIVSREKTNVTAIVLPDGHVLVHAGESRHSMEIDDDIISFAAAKNESIRIALKRIAARNTSEESGRIRKVKTKEKHDANPKEWQNQ